MKYFPMIFFLSFILIEPSLSQIPTAGLIASYKFNNDANDDSPNGNNGVLHNVTPTPDRFGHPNAAYSFNGIDNYIQIPYNPTMLLSNQFTFSAWCNFNQLDRTGEGVDWQAIVMTQGSDVCGMMVRTYEIQKIVRLYHYGASPDRSEYDLGFAAHEWRHVLLTYDGLVTKYYIDGNLAGTNAVTGNISNLNADMLIGVEQVTKYPFDGKLDDIRIYNRALSDAEIQELYHEGEFAAKIYAKFDGQLQSGASVYVYRGTGYELEDITGQDGGLLVNNLNTGYMIRCSKTLFTKPAAKSGHQDVSNTMYKLYVDSDNMLPNGDYQPYIIKNTQSTYTLEMKHPIIKYNLVVVADFQHFDPAVNFAKLETGLKKASSYLYNATDGQARFDTIAVYDAREKSRLAADVIILSENGDHNRTFGSISMYNLPLIPSYIRIFDKRSEVYIYYQDSKYWQEILIHEFGHYAFDLKEEYRNWQGLEIPEQWAYKQPDAKHPSSYGIMQAPQNNISVEEFSSNNDYPHPSNLIIKEMTEQRYKRGSSCFEYIKRLLENHGYPYDYTSNIKITLPQPGTYYSTDNLLNIKDREGPNDLSVETSTVVLNKSISHVTQVSELYTQSQPQLQYAHQTPTVDIFSLVDHRPQYLGNSSDYIGFKISSENYPLLLQRIIDGKLIQKQIDPASKKSHRLSSSKIRTSVLNYGIIVNGTISATGSNATLNITLTSESTFVETPFVQGFFGNQVDTLTLTNLGNNRYGGELPISLEDSTFDGSGMLMFTLVDSTHDTSFVISRMEATTASPNEFTATYIGNMNFNFLEHALRDSGLVLELATYATPYMKNNLQLFPVTEMFTIKPTSGSSLNDSTSLNVYYTDGDVYGLDERTINLFHFNENSLVWETVPSSSIGLQSNVVSALVNQCGIYCLFATTQSSDTTKPNSIIDLAAETVQGQGLVMLKWSAPGDDNDWGSSTSYVGKYSEVPISEINWDSISTFLPTITPGLAGTLDSTIIHLPTSNCLYYFALKSKDEAGNTSLISNVASGFSGMADSTFNGHTFGIQQRWNLISLPVRPIDYTRYVLFPSAVSNAYAYNGAYSLRDTLETGMGYWLKFLDHEDIEVWGKSVLSETTEVREGWNIIGSIDSPIPANSIITIPPGIEASNFFGYNGSSYIVTDSIYPGRGYWVKSSQGGQLVLSVLPSNSPQNKVRINPINELPPPPPDGKLSVVVNIPNRYSLNQNYPNPFNPTTTIKYGLPRAAYVSLSVYNTLGQRVALLVDEKTEAGYHEAVFDGSKIASGVYFYRIQANEYTDTKKLLLVK